MTMTSTHSTNTVPRTIRTLSTLFEDRTVARFSVAVGNDRVVSRGATTPVARLDTDSGCAAVEPGRIGEDLVDEVTGEWVIGTVGEVGDRRLVEPERGDAVGSPRLHQDAPIEFGSSAVEGDDEAAGDTQRTDACLAPQRLGQCAGAVP